VPDLSFAILGGDTILQSATPHIALDLQISNRLETEAIDSVLLRCQIHIETPRRRYSAEEQDLLQDLFGEPERWGETLRPMLWTNVCTIVPAFTGRTALKIAIPCTFDMNVSSAKYFYALEGGDIPIALFFSGTIFYQAGDRLQVAPISWNSEARFKLPARIWKQSMDLHYPQAGWLCLRRDVLDRLYRFKQREGLGTFEEAIERMLSPAEQAVL
jgi:Family of unknown function (DUF6084)